MIRQRFEGYHCESDMQLAVNLHPCVKGHLKLLVPQICKIFTALSISYHDFKILMSKKLKHDFLKAK